jgi:hypothetical protein
MPRRTDPVRLLNRSGIGYTSDEARALRHEPEAVPAEYDAVLTSRAHRAAAQQRERNRNEQAVANGWARRIQLARAEAKRRGVDVHQPLRLIRLAMEGGRSDQHIESRITALERRVYPALPDD